MYVHIFSTIKERIKQVRINSIKWSLNCGLFHNAQFVCGTDLAVFSNNVLSRSFKVEQFCCITIGVCFKGLAFRCVVNGVIKIIEYLKLGETGYKITKKYLIKHLIYYVKIILTSHNFQFKAQFVFYNSL